MFLADVNVWLALAFDAHEHHPIAKAWFDTLPVDSCCFCRLSQQGFLRLATNPNAFPQDVVSLSQAWVLYDTLRSDPRVGFAAEPANLETTWRALTQGETFSPKLWNDAYLAAFTHETALQMATFDRGFAKFAGLRFQLLS